MLFQQKDFEVVVIVPREKTDKTLLAIEDLVQIEDFSFPKLRKMYPERAHILDLLSKLDIFVEELEVKKKGKTLFKNPIDESEQITKIVEKKIEDLGVKEREIKYSVRRLETIIELIDASEFIGMVSVTPKPLEGWEDFKRELEEKEIRIVGSEVFEHEMLILTKGLTGEYMGDSDQVREKVNEDLKKTQSQLNLIDKERKNISKEFGPRIMTLKTQLELELDLIEKKKIINHSDLFTFIKGTVKAENLDKIRIEGLVLSGLKKERKKPGFLDKYKRVVVRAISRKNA